MEESRELQFRKTINSITKSDKSCIIMLDGKTDSLKDVMVDKLIDRIEPSRYELYEYNGDEDFTMRQFWEHSAHKHKIIIWDSSYKQRWKNLDFEELKDAKFFEEQMERYGFKVLCYKFKSKKENSIEYKKERNQYVITGEDANEVFGILMDHISNTLDEFLAKEPEKIKIPESIGPKKDISNIENDYVYNEDNWKELQNLYQKKIRKLHEKMIDKGKSILIVFQGIDGAGKSSTIRRLTAKMCPHWYNVYGFGAPTEEELNHHYFWRFIDKLPEPGEIVIFDRSYMERLTAERVLKLNDNGWVNGVDEINEFERELENNGIHIVKFWFNIDKETQAERFKERENNPLKTWKISKSDYKTREKWDEYILAFAEMLGSTDTNIAPWNYIDSRNKREARVQAMEILVREMKKVLKND